MGLILILLIAVWLIRMSEAVLVLSVSVILMLGCCTLWHLSISNLISKLDVLGQI